MDHHAYAIIGGIDEKSKLIGSLRTDHKITTIGNPDFFDLKFETFNIDDARNVKSLHATRPVSASGKKIFILTMNGITVEAQNALLKLLEEPAEYAHFYLIIPSAHLLLPTVKSRMQIIDDRDPARGRKTDSELKKEAQIFFAAAPEERLELVKTFMSDIDKEKKTKQDAIDLIHAIEEIIYDKRGIREGKHALEALDTARKYIHDRAPSVKMLLEYVALNVDRAS